MMASLISVVARDWVPTEDSREKGRTAAVESPERVTRIRTRGRVEGGAREGDERDVVYGRRPR